MLKLNFLKKGLAFYSFNYFKFFIKTKKKLKKVKFLTYRLKINVIKCFLKLKSKVHFKQLFTLLLVVGH